MPTFKPPRAYGREDQHVFSPAHHLGYIYLVAALVDGLNPAEYIIRACSDADAEGAPRDAVCRESGRWKRRSEMNLSYGRRLDTYARALTVYAEELKAERRKGTI